MDTKDSKTSNPRLRRSSFVDIRDIRGQKIPQCRNFRR